jgi:hypothetical protein
LIADLDQRPGEVKEKNEELLPATKREDSVARTLKYFSKLKWNAGKTEEKEKQHPEESWV